MSDDASFCDLMQRVRHGDDEAAAELHRRYSEDLQRIIRVRMTNRGIRRKMDSVDVCQSVFANFFARMSLGQYEVADGMALMKLLSRMAQNRVLHHAKIHKAARRDVRRDEESPVETFGLAASEESPSRIVWGRELIEQFQARLSEDERRLVEGRREARSWHEISAGLGRTAEAVRKQYERAIARVSQELGLEDLNDG
jgi:RNA polymerase sigma factor (sigma-70 family)